ncbi:MAG: hypothetical protein ABS81_01815 [Pseudonocardia sp. SCN 72-86]|nr:MAG: hypothetical protein ABS81_01815 [Pseudonocardia sp. SCN 72-86]
MDGTPTASSGTAAPATTRPAVDIVGVTKSFGGRVVLDGVDLALRSGEVHALMGANGSGKSTLIKVLSGFHAPDSGEISVGGAPIDDGRDAIAFVHQDLGLIGELTVAENFVIEERLGGLLRPVKRRDEYARVSAELSALGMPILPDTRVDQLSPVERSIVAIARCVRHASESVAVVMDEPTAALPGPEVARLFDAIRSLAGRGVAVLLVTHKLDEVFELAQHVTVLRNGQVVASQAVSALSRSELVRLIAGHTIDELAPAGRADVDGDRPRVLSVSDLRATELDGASFDVCEGEIVGLAGVEGSGYKELLHVLVGNVPKTGGTIRLAGADVGSPTPRAALDHGCVLVPADRAGQGLHLDFSLRENIGLPAAVAARPLSRIRRGDERGRVGRWMASTGVNPPEPERPAKELSGGNQQKVLLAKWLSMSPRVLLLEDPTQAVDVGARDEIHRLLLETARDGTAMVIASSDPQELSALCDRVVVMRKGRDARVLGRAEISDTAIVHASLDDEAEATTTTSREGDEQ